MRLNQVQVSYKPGQTFVLYPLGDVHFGSANCDTALFDATINHIRADRRALWLGMGDMVESIAPNDKRWQAGGVDEKVVNLASQDRIGDVYVEKLADRLRPIAKKCIGYGDGNHEATFNRYYYTNLSVRVLEALGIPDRYTEWGCITRLAFESREHHYNYVRIFSHHGWQSGRQEGNKVNESRRLLAYVDADLYLTGHSHSKWIVPQTRLQVNPSFTKMVAKTVYTAHTGSFLRTLQQNHVGYAERAGFPPTTLGCIRFVLRPLDDRVEIEAVQ